MKTLIPLKQSFCLDHPKPYSTSPVNLGSWEKTPAMLVIINRFLSVSSRLSSD